MYDSFKAIIDEEKLIFFKKITGDINPLHLIDDYAIEKGFNARVVYGMLTASFYSKLIGVYLPGENSLIHSIDTKFLYPVYLNDELEISGELSYINNSMRQLEVACKIVNQNNIKVSTALIKVGTLND